MKGVKLVIQGYTLKLFIIIKYKCRESRERNEENRSIYGEIFNAGG